MLARQTGCLSGVSTAGRKTVEPPHYHFTVCVFDCDSSSSGGMPALRVALPPQLLILGATRAEGRLRSSCTSSKTTARVFCEGFVATSERITGREQATDVFAGLLVVLPLITPPPPVFVAHERRGVDACAGSDRGLLSRRQAVYLRSGGKALPGKGEPRIPAEGKCIKAPDWRL